MSRADRVSGTTTETLQRHVGREPCTDINICFDTNFAEAAAPLAAQGARLLLVPAQNMMKRRAADEWKLRHNEIRAARVRETGMWLVSADVTGERGSDYVGCGPTSVMSPTAEVVAQVPLSTVGMVRWCIV